MHHSILLTLSQRINGVSIYEYRLQAMTLQAALLVVPSIVVVSNQSILVSTELEEK